MSDIDPRFYDEIDSLPEPISHPIDEPQAIITTPTQASIKDAIYTAGSIDVESIPARDFLYDHLLLRGYISALIAPGGTGKSTLAVVISVSVAIGKSLIGGHLVPEARNVLILNNEEDEHELNRRIVGVCKHFDIDLTDLDGRLFVRSGYKFPVLLATNGLNKNVVATPHREQLIEFVTENNVALIVGDPHVSLHDIPENDNTLQNEVVKIYRYICATTSAAVLLVAHTKKLGGDSESHAGDVESMRGATAVKDGARIAFTMAKMSKKSAKNLGIEWEEASRLCRVDDAKKNYSSQDPEATWLKMEPQRLPNGDWVGVPVSYDLSPYLDARSEADSGGMGAQGFAEHIEALMTEDAPEKTAFRYSEIKRQIMSRLGCGTTKADDYIHLLSKNKKQPTKIVFDGRFIDYWAEKGSGKTAPWTIHREVMT